jgi:hypothetical protein
LVTNFQHNVLVQTEDAQTRGGAARMPMNIAKALLNDSEKSYLAISLQTPQFLWVST